MQGYIFLHRQLKENWLWKDKPFSKGQAWIDILLRVNHKPAKVPIGNQIVEVEKGQTIWSVKDMANEWGWSRKKVDNFLKVLETDCMIAQKRTTKYTLLTVENWASYQVEGRQKNINGTSNEHQTNTNKNEKNEKNEKKLYTQEFEDLYKVYPRPNAKRDTYKNYCKRLKEYTHEELINSVLVYKRKVEKEKIQMPYASNNFFGNKAYFEDFIGVEYNDAPDRSHRIGIPPAKSAGKRRPEW